MDPHKSSTILSTQLTMLEWQDYDWDDIEPVAITSNEPRLASIAYTEIYQQVLGLFLAVSAKQEYSERALALTSKCIELNPAHYSVWDYRYDILRTLGQPENEAWLSEVTMDNPKNYQVWNYRQHLQSPQHSFFDTEFTVIKVVLGDDTKNFHAWSHLKWLVTSAKASGFDLGIDNLLVFTSFLLDLDVFNNSCWSFRYFLLYSVYPAHLSLQQDLEYIRAKITVAPDNEAAWNYLIGIGAPNEAVREISLEFDTPRALEARAAVSDSEKTKLYTKLIELEPWNKGLWEYKMGLKA